MGVLLNFQRAGNAFFDRPTDAMETANTGVAEIAKDELLDTASGDHLVVNEVGGQAAER